MNKKCKNCAHYISEPDKQDGVTERYCTEISERVNPNWTCPLWTKDISKKETRMEISKEVIEMSKLPWFPAMMKELGYEPVTRPKDGHWVHGKELSRNYIGDACIGVDYDKWRCSECNYQVEGRPLWRYCPRCGAKMDEVANETD